MNRARTSIARSVLSHAILITYTVIALGPVLVIIGYKDIDDAVRIANDSDFGLAGNVAGKDLDKARSVARQIRSGLVSINDGFDFNMAFGGYKRSGNGREWGEHGFTEYVEVKSLVGYTPEHPERHVLGWADEVDADALFASGEAWGIRVERRPAATP